MINLGLNDNEIRILSECKGKNLIEVTRSDLPRMLAWEKLQLKFDEFYLLIEAKKTNNQKENELKFEDDVFLSAKLCKEDNFDLDGTGFRPISQKVNQSLEEIYIVNFKSTNDIEGKPETDFEYTYAIVAKIGNEFYALINENLSEMIQIECYSTEDEMQSTIQEKCMVLNEEESGGDSRCILDLIHL